MPLRHIIIVCVCIAACCNVYAQPSGDPYSFNAIAGFANHLVQQKEYYRAYQEYHRLHIYYPAMYPYDKYFVSTLYCHYEGRQYQKLLEQIDSTMLAQPVVWIFAFDSALSITSPVLADIALQSPGSMDDTEAELMVLKRKLAYSLLAVNDYNKLSPYKTIAQDYDLQRIYEFSRFTRSRLKNPYAAFVWGIIPGAGYIYSDNVENGIIAAIVIGICTAVTYFAVDTGNSGIAFVTGAAGTFFYGGSILGGYLSARRTNSQIMKELNAYIQEELKFAQDREIVFNKYGKPKAQ